MINSLRDPINGITHIVGALLSIVGVILLLCSAAKKRKIWHIVSFAIYGFTLVSLYTMSALYHSLNISPVAVDILRQFDHAMIYFLIVGTLTPLCLTILRGGWGWSLFGINWGLAIAGITLKLIFRYPSKFAIAVFFIFYIIMGWIIFIAWHPLNRGLSKRGIFWLILGGLFYTIGVVILNIKQIDFGYGFGAHQIWHLFVIAGSFCHFWLMFKYVMNLR